MDFSIRIICQKDSFQRFVNPSKNKDVQVCGYSSCMQNVRSFNRNDIAISWKHLSRLVINFEITV